MSRSISRPLFYAGLLAATLLAPQRAHAQSYPPAWSSSSNYAAGDQVQISGNTYRAVKAISSPGGNPTSDYTDWQLNSVLSNTTLMIGTGQTFPTLTAAWTYAANTKVGDGAYLHFYVSSANGVHYESFNAPYVLDHSSGARMALLGDNYTNDNFTFFSSNGFVLDTGHSFNTLSGFTMNNGGSDLAVAVKVAGGAALSSVANMMFVGYGTCLFVTGGGSMSVNNTLHFLSQGAVVAEASANGSIVFPQGFTTEGPGTNSHAIALLATQDGSIIAPNSNLSYFGNAAEAQEGGTIFLWGSTLNNCSTAAYAFDAGLIDITQASLNNNGVGCTAADRGFVNCVQASFQNSTTDDITAVNGGYVRAFLAGYSSTHQDGAVNGAFITS
jgi:hypothetical protein